MSIQLIGIPFDLKSSFIKGSAKGPDSIRKVLHEGSSSYLDEEGRDIIKDCGLIDEGNVAAKSFDDLYSSVCSLLKKDHQVLFLGGDHSISYPLVKALQAKVGKFDLLHFDAHTDLYDEYEGDRYSHACPFARIMEEGLVESLTQVGIRTMNKHQQEQVSRFGVEVITMKEIQRLPELYFKNPLYISVDLDVFDPAYAPGVSHHEPGGLNPRQVITIIQELNCPIIGADIVELNPLRDQYDITAALAAKLLKEICGKMYANIAAI